MKANLVGLLKQQLPYWKHRGKIKCVTLGDENYHFLILWILIIEGEIILLPSQILMVAQLVNMQPK
jgi:hypothetical protein